MLKPDIGTDSSLCRALEVVLGSVYVLAFKTKGYHWNITGTEGAVPLHTLFGEQYNTLDDMADEIAERCRKIDGVVLKSMAEFVQKSVLKEETSDNLTSQQMIQNLLSDHELLIRKLRDIIVISNKSDDFGSDDDLRQWLKSLEKMAWFLRISLEGK